MMVAYFSFITRARVTAGQGCEPSSHDAKTNMNRYYRHVHANPPVFILYKIYPTACRAAIVLFYVDVAIVMKSMGARVLIN